MAIISHGNEITRTVQNMLGRRTCDRMVVGFTTTCAICAHHHLNCEFEPCSWQGILDTTLCDKVVSDLRQVDGFLRFPPPIKLTAMI